MSIINIYRDLENRFEDYDQIHNISTHQLSTFRILSRCPQEDRHNETLEGILVNNSADDRKLVKSFRNGCYQHIMFLGISGFVICNHCDRDILLVDPWPSYLSEWSRLIPSCYDRRLTDEQTYTQLQGEIDEDDVARWRQDIRSAKSRLEGLVNFLREALSGNKPEEERYILSGILLSHMHFDHAEDIVILLELLAATTDSETSGYTDHCGRTFVLSGPPVSVDRLPKIYCDFDSIVYLLSYYFYVPITSMPEINDEGHDYWAGKDECWNVLSTIARQCRQDPQISTIWTRTKDGRELTNDTWKQVQQRYSFVPQSFNASISQLIENDGWYEIRSGNSRLFYDDSYNDKLDADQRCKAGLQCAEFEVGHFRVTPYVWDHMNTGAFKLSQREIDEQSSGDLQRITAFLIQQATIAGAKKTFIVGSSGEMNERLTSAILDEQDLPQIEAHLLIHAIVRPYPIGGGRIPFIGLILNFVVGIEAYTEYLAKHIKAEEALIFTHLEEFCRFVARPNEYKQNFNDSVNYNLIKLREKIERIKEGDNQENIECAESIENLITNNKIYILGRRGFELDYPANPRDFALERNDYLG